MQLLVISDIHVGSGPLDDCDSELESGLVDFLGGVAGRAEPTTLVINGDFLDFAQAEPWQSKDLESYTSDGVPLCFTEEQSLEKLKGIVQKHPAIFEALNRLTNSKANHRIIILPGNHDADFFWDRVRDEFAQAVSKGNPETGQKLHFHLQQVYQPGDFPGVWIEHGHQYDDCNKFTVNGVEHWSEEAKPIFADKNGVPRLLECVGTRFMIKFMNSLDADYPFVDNVKPFSKFVKMFLLSTVNSGFGPLKVAVAYWGFLKFFGYTLGKSPRDLLSTSDDRHKLLRQFAQRLGQLGKGRTQRLVSRLAQEQFNLQGMPLDFYLQDDERSESLLDFLCLNPETLEDVQTDDEGLLSAGTPGYLTLGGGFIQDETAELKAAATTIVTNGLAKAVIMGHTHEPVDARAELNYVNTGSWTRYFRESADKSAWSWDLLKKSAFDRFPYELAYAVVTAEPGNPLSRQIFLP